MLGDLLEGMSKIIGGTIGLVGGLTYSAIATTLGVSIKIVEEAVEAGCKTKEEIENFIKNG